MKAKKYILPVIFILLFSLPVLAQQKDEIKAIGHIASWDKVIKAKQDVIKDQIIELEKQHKTFRQWYKSKFNHCGPVYKSEEDKTKFFRCPSEADKKGPYYRTNLELLVNDKGDTQYRFRLENWDTVNAVYMPISYRREVILTFSGDKIKKVEISTKLIRENSTTYDEYKSIEFEPAKIEDTVTKFRIGSKNDERLAAKKNDGKDVRVITTKFPRMSSMLQKKLLDRIENSLQTVIYRLDKLIRAYEIKRKSINDNQAAGYDEISPILK